jgi:acetoin utilization deacetylase AcuC-like enzyme
VKWVFNTRHALHAPTHEFFRGQLVPAFETPARADYVLAALRESAHGEPLAVQDHGLAPIARVHSPAYLKFLQGAHAEWCASGQSGDAFPAVWPVRSLRHDVEPRSFAARMGLYSMDSGTPLTGGSFEAAYVGAQAALTALSLVQQGERSAYVLTRPPGHHAGFDFFGGYCFINHAAVAAQAARDAGAQRVAILDVDYHHGNGTQAIFYDRADVLFASIHGDPMTEYPFFLGHADELGSGAGLGFNVNYPLPAGASVKAWFGALDSALEQLKAFSPTLLIVSLGVDTYAEDPISHFQLRTEHFSQLGATVAATGWPVLWLQEGGYATEAMGLNVRAVLDGFDAAAR